jgi:deoxyribonuclease V
MAMSRNDAMKLAVDLSYDGDGALAGAVAFAEWDSFEATKTYVSRIQHVEKAAPGEAWRRDLACLLQLLREHSLQPEVIVIDGFVYVDPQETPGLGQYLHHALGSRVPVIGVSKSPMKDSSAQFEVVRDEEARPLFVTSVGIELGAAKARVRAMHGKKRVPTLLKLVARVAAGKVA